MGMFNGFDQWEKEGDAEFYRKYKKARTFVHTTMGIWFTIVVLILFASIYGIVYGVIKIKQHGMKVCVEKVWNGPTKE